MGDERRLLGVTLVAGRLPARKEKGEMCTHFLLEIMCGGIPVLQLPPSGLDYDRDISSSWVLVVPTLRIVEEQRRAEARGDRCMCQRRFVCHFR